mmetsp:Transcript_68219/g.177121  ORF Transcript_68219/g.177121 Transcript_68219/m.177121 type:complete len:348 (+) Transcript_68219:125-1168(+)
MGQVACTPAKCHAACFEVEAAFDLESSHFSADSVVDADRRTGAIQVIQLPSMQGPPAEDDEACSVLVSGKSPTAQSMATQTQQIAVAQKPKLPGLLFSSVRGPAARDGEVRLVKEDGPLEAANTIAKRAVARAVAEKPGLLGCQFSSMKGPSVEEDEGICSVQACSSSAAKEDQPGLRSLQIVSMEGRADENTETCNFQENPPLPSFTQTPQDELDDLRRYQEELALQKVRNERENLRRVACFLKAHGFKGVCTKKRGLMGFLFPLHAAVNRNDVKLVLALLSAGADPWQTDSCGRTPYQLALSREDGRGSHAEVLHALTRAGAAVAPAAVLIRSMSAPLVPAAGQS